ncbi:putative secondary metabolism biosynthetic enzyme [Microsporum ferrugineum]
MDPLPISQRVLRVKGLNEIEAHETCPLPAMEEDEILVRVRCVGINPVDVKILDMSPVVGATAGCEFAGDVAKIGPLVKNNRLKVGTPVFGCVLGNNVDRPSNGAFAEYVAATGDLVFVLPSHLSYQQGATLGAALPTVGMALYHALRLPLPYFNKAGGACEMSEAAAVTPVIMSPKPMQGGRPSPEKSKVAPKYVLVYGGSTVCGAIALQMIRKSGFVPVCTCSPRNFDMVKARGAQAVFDYQSPSCADDIKRYTADSLAYALDCIADVGSMRICYAAMGHLGGRYMGLNPFPVRAHTRRDIQPDYILVYTMFGKAINLPRPFGRPARPRDLSFAEGWCHSVQAILDSPGQIYPHPVEEGMHNLYGVINGLDRVRKGDMSGAKLVYNISI